jgi:hypothetical protein
MAIGGPFMKSLLGLMLISLSLSSYAKTQYLEIQVDIGSCINAGLLPSEARHGSSWKLVAKTKEAGALRISSGAPTASHSAQELKLYNGYYSGPNIDIVVALDDEDSSEVSLILEEKDRGVLRKDKNHELHKFNPKKISSGGLWIGKEYWNHGSCISIF